MNLPAWHGKAIVSRTAPRGERVAQRDGVIKPPSRNPPRKSLVLEVRSYMRESERERRERGRERIEGMGMMEGEMLPSQAAQGAGRCAAGRYAPARLSSMLCLGTLPCSDTPGLPGRTVSQGDIRVQVQQLQEENEALRQQNRVCECVDGSGSV